MKKQMQKIITCMMVLVLLAAVQVSYAQPVCDKGGGEYRGDKGQKMQEVMDQVGLTPEQREALWQQKEKSREKMKELRDYQRDLKRSLRSELEKTDTNESLVNQIVSKMKTTQGDMIDQRVEGFMAMKKILTPEQFQKMSQLRKQHKYQKGDHKKHGFGGHDEKF